MEEKNQAWPGTLRHEMGKRKDLKLYVQVCPHSEVTLEQIHGRDKDVSYSNLRGKHLMEKEKLRKCPHSKSLLDMFKKVFVTGVKQEREIKMSLQT